MNLALDKGLNEIYKDTMSNKPKKRTPQNPVTKARTDRTFAFIDNAISYWSPEYLSEISGISLRQIYRWKNREVLPYKKSLEKLAQSFGIAWEDIVNYGDDPNIFKKEQKEIRPERPRESTETQQKWALPFYKCIIKQESLSDDVVPDEDIEGNITIDNGMMYKYILEKKFYSKTWFDESWLYEIGTDPEELFFIKCFEDMHPTIPINSIVMVDKGQYTLTSDRIYLIGHENNVFIRRIVLDKLPNLQLISDNKSLEIINTTIEKVKFLGRCIWFSAFL